MAWSHSFLLASSGEEGGTMPDPVHQDLQEAMIYAPGSLETSLILLMDALGQQ
jgi:hypothetical protein